MHPPLSFVHCSNHYRSIMPVSVRDRIANLTGASAEDLSFKPIKAASLVAPEVLTVDVPYSQLVIYKAGRFAEFSKADYDKHIKDFKVHVVIGRI